MNVMKSVKSFTSKHGSTLCVVGVIVGIGVTIYETWQARPKVDKIMDERKKAVDDIQADESKSEEEKKKAVNGENVEAAKKVAVTVIPVVVSGVATGGLAVAGHVMDARKIANMAATIEVGDLAYRKLEKKMTEVLGEEKTEEIKEEANKELAREKVERTTTFTGELSVIEQGKGGSQIFYDPMFDKLFKSDVNTISELCHTMNERMGQRPDKEPYMGYDEFYDALQLSIPGAAYHFRFSGDYLMKPNMYDTMRFGDVSCIILDWYHAPYCVAK